VVAACFLSSSAFAAFNVLIDVNSGKPPKDIMVVFDKTKDPKSFKPVDRKGNAEFSFAEDGAIVIKINQRGPSELVFPFPEVMDIAKANLVLLTCKLEGQSRTSWQGNWGQWTPYTGSKLWWGAFTTDTAGTRSASGAGLDSSSPGGFLPTEMTTIRLPAMFFARRGEGWADPSQTNALMLLIGNIRDTAEREFTLTIDRISVAE